MKLELQTKVWEQEKETALKKVQWIIYFQQFIHGMNAITLISIENTIITNILFGITLFAMTTNFIIDKSINKYLRRRKESQIGT